MSGNLITASAAFTSGGGKYVVAGLGGTKTCLGALNTIWATSTTLVGLSISTEQDYKAGDTISLNWTNQSGVTVSLDLSPPSNWICITRIGN
jgi:hypothetical protein